MRLLRRILTLLIVTAYLGATVFQVAPVYAANAAMSSSSLDARLRGFGIERAPQARD